MSALKINTTIIEELIDNALSVENIKIEMDHCNITISGGLQPGTEESRANVLFQKFDKDGETKRDRGSGLKQWAINKLAGRTCPHGTQDGKAESNAQMLRTNKMIAAQKISFNN